MKNAAIKVTIAAILVLIQVRQIDADTRSLLPETDITATHEHQSELVGKRSPASALGYSLLMPNTSRNVSKLVHEIARENLPGKFKIQSAKIAKAIIREANRYQMDPLFLAAVIRHESQFNPQAIGGVGEIGLMQLRPSTAEDIAKKLGVKNWDLANPVTNIEFGAFYFSKLRGKFDRHAQLYVAAYNMGAANVRKLVDQDKKPKVYAAKVMEHYTSYLKRLNLILLQQKNVRLASSN